MGALLASVGFVPWSTPWPDRTPTRCIFAFQPELLVRVTADGYAKTPRLFA